MKKSFLGMRFLAYLISAAVVMSSLVFAMPAQTASAASAGSYNLTVTINVTNKADDIGNIQDATYTIYYCPINGTGSETSMTYNMANYLLSKGEKNVDITVDGFPTKVYCHHDATWNDKVDYKITKFAVQGTAGWTGSQAMNSGGWGNSDVDATLTLNLTKPYANTMTASFKSETVNCPKTSSAAKTTNTLTYGATDQYGVTMASSLCTVTVASNKATEQVNGSNAVTTTNKHTGSDTVSVPYAANLKGTTNSQKITATCSWSGSSKQTKKATFTLDDAMYTSTFKYYTTNESSASGKAHTVTGTTYFDDVLTVPPAAKAVTEYHTNAKHYTDGHYNLPAEGTGIKADATYTMAYTSAVHSYEETAVITAPTCTEKGVSTFTCTGCTYSYNGETPELGHTWSAWTPAGDHATHKRTCSRCNKTETENCSYSLTGSKEATCTEDGYNTYTCSVCGDSYTEVLNATGHTWGDWTPVGDHATHTRTCSVCNTTETADCSYSVTDSKDATCTEDGYKTYTCSACGDSYTEVLNATGHTWGAWTPAGDHATHTRTCSVCDETETADCSYSVTDSKDATCTEDGYKTYTCSVCGDSYTEVLNALGHTWGDWTPAGDHATHTRTCSVCDKTETADCSYSLTDSKDATCTEDGYKTYTCSACGDSYTEVLNALGHNQSELKIGSNPENGTAGFMYYECQRCAKIFAVGQDGNLDPTWEYDTVEEVMSNANAEIPAPSFNTYVKQDYNYAARGVSLRWANEDDADTTVQATRFTASLQIPVGSQVTDFGYVYTQTKYLNGGVEPENTDNAIYGIEHFTLENVGTAYRVYQQSVYGTASEGNGYTTHDYDGNTVYTFNLVVKIRNKNWQTHYAARAYIKYTYKGHEFIVYDNAYSSRTVYYVSQRVCSEEALEKDIVKRYFNNKVLNFIDPNAYPIIEEPLSV